MLAILMAFSWSVIRTPVRAQQQIADTNGVSAKRQNVILLHLPSLNRRVWFLGVGMRDVHVLRGELPVPTIRQNQKVIYVVKEPLSVEIGPTRLDFTGPDVLLNNQSLGASLNAVVGKDHRILIGAFVRDFD